MSQTDPFRWGQNRHRLETISHYNSLRMYENRRDPLLTYRQFFIRLIWHALISLSILLFSLIIGILGYHFLGSLTWLDSLLNAAMILGGMGPVNTITSNAGKWFASFYALYAGVVFLVVAGIVIAPLAHRLLHHLHLDSRGGEDQND